MAGNTKSLYEIMENIHKLYTNDSINSTTAIGDTDMPYSETVTTSDAESVNDITYLGTITMNEQTPNGPIQTTHDVFRMTIVSNGLTVTKYCDETGKCIAGCGRDGKIYPSDEFKDEDLSFLGQLEALNQSQGISLKDMDDRLAKIAKALGIPKSEIVSLSEVELNKKLQTKASKNSDSITLTDDLSDDPEQAKLQQEETKNALQVSSKNSVINLDDKYNGQYTLAQLLGLPPGYKMYAVYTDSIRSKNRNTTKLTFLFESPDGNIEERPDLLSQFAGEHSSLQTENISRDGSKVESKQFNSSYKLMDPHMNTNSFALGVNVDSYGYIQVSLAMLDPKSPTKQAISQDLRDGHDSVIRFN